MQTWFFGYITGASAALNLDEDIMEDAYDYVDSILSRVDVATDAKRQQFQCAVDSVHLDVKKLNSNPKGNGTQ